MTRLRSYLCIIRPHVICYARTAKGANPLVDIKCYLPAELGQRAKDADLAFSNLLQEAVREELEMIHARENTLQTPREFNLELEDDEGRGYTGRFEGELIAEDREIGVYLTADERVLIYEPRKAQLEVLEVLPSTDELRELLGDGDVYVEACHGLGLRPIVNL